MNISQAIETVAPQAPTKLERKVRGRRKLPPPIEDNPITELRRLVQEHSRWTQTKTRWGNTIRDTKIPNTDEIIKCTVPDTIRADISVAIENLDFETKRLEAQMSRELVKFPIYNLFLSKVFGFGPITCANLIARVKIHMCTKPSQLWRYCGNAVDPSTGRLEKRQKGAGSKAGGSKGTYNDKLRTALYLAMCCMPKARGATKKTSKYLRRWDEAVFARKTMGREVGAYGAGRAKALDLVLEDLYIVWRTLEGLPVWPDLYSVRRGFYHGGRPCINEGRVLTIDEALHVVGDFEAHPMPVTEEPPVEAAAE